jgi:hypothetical protein
MGLLKQNMVNPEVMSPEIISGFMFIRTSWHKKPLKSLTHLHIHHKETELLIKVDCKSLTAPYTCTGTESLVLDYYQM